MADTTEPKPQTYEAHFHKYITKNSEYLFSGDLCVEVRARGKESSTKDHGAVRQRLQALVRWSREGGHQVLRGELPKIGDSLFFGERGSELLTTVVHQIEALSPRRVEGGSSLSVG